MYDPEAKDFWPWFSAKREIHAKKQRPRYVHAGEIWWARVGCNVGQEQDGAGKDFLRPVLIVYWCGANLVWVVPLTSKLKKGFFYETYRLSNQEKLAGSAILSQMRTIDTKRLIKNMGPMSKTDFKRIKGKLRDCLR